jgi:4-carboxymuconolactone decarboxylase
MIDRAGFIGATAAVLATSGGAAEAQTAPEAPGSDPGLPRDVYASSRSRVPLIRREMLESDENRKAYDEVASGRSTTAGLQGPAGISLYSASAGRFATALNGNLRANSGLDARLRELAILVSARESESAVEWTAHEILARDAGLAGDVIDVVRYRKPVTGLGEREAAIIQLGREAIVQHKVSPKTYATAIRLFGTGTVVNICFLMGDYMMTALLLHTFDQQLPPGQTSTLPHPA